MQKNPRQMKALWLEGGSLSVKDDVSIPVPGPGEALLQVRLAGICATDLEMVKGYYPFTGIIGHEFVADVISAPGYPAWQGQRVVGEINVTCGSCSMCRSGFPAHCERRSILGISNRSGVFAEFTMLPLVNLHHVPDVVPDDAAVFTEPLAAALEVLEQVSVRPSDSVLVLGGGRLGQLIAQALFLTGCDLRVAARYPYQQELLSTLGIRLVSISDIDRRTADVVVEATGSADGFRMACQAVRPRGTLVLKSTYSGAITANLSALVVDEVTVVGSRCGPFSPALRMLAEGRVDPTPMIIDRYPINDAILALDKASQPGVLKVLLEPGRCG